jgi:hypothetical protein
MAKIPAFAKVHAVGDAASFMATFIVPALQSVRDKTSDHVQGVILDGFDSLPHAAANSAVRLLHFLLLAPNLPPWIRFIVFCRAPSVLALPAAVAYAGVDLMADDLCAEASANFQQMLSSVDNASKDSAAGEEIVQLAAGNFFVALAYINSLAKNAVLCKFPDTLASEFQAAFEAQLGTDELSKPVQSILQVPVLCCVVIASDRLVFRFWLAASFATTFFAMHCCSACPSMAALRSLIASWHVSCHCWSSLAATSLCLTRKWRFGFAKTSASVSTLMPPWAIVTWLRITCVRTHASTAASLSSSLTRSPSTSLASAASLSARSSGPVRRR